MTHARLPPHEARMATVLSQKRAEKPQKRAKQSRADASNVSALPSAEKGLKRSCDSLCPQCCKAFAKRRRDQVYCTPNCRRIACEKRKEALVEAVHILLRWRGVSLHEAALAVEAAFKQLQAAVRALGYRYDEFAKKWEPGIGVSI